MMHGQKNIKSRKAVEKRHVRNFLLLQITQGAILLEALQITQGAILLEALLS
jgi:hypothetical protein